MTADSIPRYALLGVTAVTDLVDEIVVLRNSRSPLTAPLTSNVHRRWFCTVSKRDDSPDCARKAIEAFLNDKRLSSAVSSADGW